MIRETNRKKIHHMKLSLYYALLSSTLLLSASFVNGQDEGFIYGKVYTEDSKVYQGPIRWGKEEVYWTDMFNAAKERNENLRYLSDREREQLDDKHMNWFSWDDRASNWFGSRHWNARSSEEDYIHQFSCLFGEIKTVTPMGRKYVEIELQNGIKHEVSGEGYNDVGLDIRVMDPELGEVEIAWGRIEKIEFMNTPSKLENRFGQPLYGTVEAFGDKFTGLIQWDHDERLTTDKLDGDSDDGDMSIDFGKIRSIERRGGRSLVILKSGRELYLDGSNDVSSGHRGVIVMNKDFPSIDIPWNEFDNVVFADKPAAPVATYNDFKSQKELTGTVTTQDGKSYTGKLVYDLDEIYDFELLQGKEGEFEFATPFRNVKKITTKGEHRATVELKNGKRLTLDEGQDVNERNQGMLVFASGKSEPIYIAWHDINEIEFK
jgi:hypothetical protein